MTKIKIFILILLILFELTACQPAAAPSLEGNPAMNYPFGRPLNIAHRGARSLAPENTLQAAEKAFEIGADLWELDVAMTADNALVVIHDDTLPRTSNAKTVFPDRSPWEVHTFTLDELRTLDFGTWYVESDPFNQIAAGNITESDLTAYRGAQIPTLREALQLTRDHKWKVNIEIKDLSGKPGDAIVVENVVELVEALDMQQSVIISSFNHTYIQRVKQKNPAILTAALVTRQVSDPVALLKNSGANGYNPGLNGLSDLAALRTVREAGYDVYVWTVNDVNDMKRLIDAGVSGMFTDYPQLLGALLSGNSH